MGKYLRRWKEIWGEKVGRRRSEENSI